MRFLILVLVGLALGCEEKAGSLAVGQWVLVGWVLVMWVLVALSLGSKEKLGAIWQIRAIQHKTGLKGLMLSVGPSFNS